MSVRASPRFGREPTAMVLPCPCSSFDPVEARPPGASVQHAAYGVRIGGHIPPTPMRLTHLALLAALALPACDGSALSVEAPAMEGPAVVRGAVVSVDTAPLAYDGPATVVVATDGGRATVKVPSNLPTCEASGLGLVFELAPGDAVEARGDAGPKGAVVPCASADHYLRRAP